MMYILCLFFLATSVAGDFGNDFYRLLAKEHANQNIISSPLALEIALNMIYIGAKDKSGKELKEALNTAENKNEVAGKYNAFSKVLKSRESVVSLDFANSIYVSDKFHIFPEFSKLVSSFNSQAVGLSVASADKAASAVNAWVKAQTHGNIATAVTAKDIDPSLKVLLLNAFAFKGKWLFKFHSIKTKKENFRTSSGKVQQVKMMSHHGFYKAAELPDMDAKVLQLPYHKSALSLFVFLPNKVDGLSQLEDKIGGYSYKGLTSRQVQIKLPKFKIEFTTELSNILKKLKINDVFGAAANLQELVKEKDAGLSKVIHKGFFEINEDGAGLASIIGFRDSFIKNKELPSAMNFKANHPFAYVIRDAKAIYFQGHIVNPE